MARTARTRVHFTFLKTEANQPSMEHKPSRKGNRPFSNHEILAFMGQQDELPCTQQQPVTWAYPEPPTTQYTTSHAISLICTPWSQFLDYRLRLKRCLLSKKKKNQNQLITSVLCKSMLNDATLKLLHDAAKHVTLVTDDGTILTGENRTTCGETCPSAT